MKQHEITGRTEILARGLGWFSIGLGLTEILAPGKLSELVGADDRPTMMRILGAREIVSGIGILTQDHPAESLWSRVAGDAMDLAVLGSALTERYSKKKKLIAAISAVAGVTALDIYASLKFTQAGRTHLAKSLITINQSQDEVYAFWRDPLHLIQCMGPGSLDFEVVAARPDEFIEFRSADGRLVKSGSVSLSPAVGRDGTEVTVVVDGVLPVRLLHEFVRRTKRMIETGEVPTTEGQSAGPRLTAPVSRLIHRLEGKEVA